MPPFTDWDSIPSSVPVVSEGGNPHAFSTTPVLSQANVKFEEWQGIDVKNPPRWSMTPNPSFDDIPMSTPLPPQCRHSSPNHDFRDQSDCRSADHEDEGLDNGEDTEAEDFFCLGIDADTRKQAMQIEELKRTAATKADFAFVLRKLYGFDHRGLEHQEPAPEQQDEIRWGPKHRDPEVVKLQRRIRLHTKKLLKVGQIDPNTQLPYEVCLASKPDIEAFLASKMRRCGPTLERFAIDLTSTKSAWNKKLARVFADSFLSSEQHGPPEDHDHIVDMFLTHLYHLIVLQLRDWRSDACGKHLHGPAMEKLLRVLEELPLECHSGDESAHIGGDNRYVIKDIPWRNPAIRQLFKVLDWLHLSLRFNGTHRAGRGAFPRVRVEAGRFDIGDAPPGLPQNFYRPSYLAGLDEEALEALKMKPPVEIAIPAFLFWKAARYRRVLTWRDGLNILEENDPALPPAEETYYPLGRVA
ncbi:hypothetical protein NLJ89_g5303 [Agrocybe chaxingu]|uniref:Uncharacterized protein n=1 Tax=Agrocybe chaxingu TaxID=84603 RepID=A0A9W8K1A3_9AGAR|nr:hypothetical protein NLJ89_g5303 [Agrocybe chaxingu]